MPGGSLPASVALPLISRYESGNRNIPQNVTTYDSAHSASGYYQITNTTWQQYAGQAGVDTSLYPTAMSAPYADQTAVATAIYNNEGAGPWSRYNAPLRQSLTQAGYTDDLGPYLGPLGTGGGGSTMSGSFDGSGTDFNSVNAVSNTPSTTSPNTFDYNSYGTDPLPGLSNTTPNSSGQTPTLGYSLPSVGSMTSGALTAVEEIVSRFMVELVALVLIILGLVWAMRKD